MSFYTVQVCIPDISERMFDLGCLAPALAIILILASLKQRKHFKLEFWDGRPGLLVPINFLRSFSYSNRFTIAATFGATGSTCLQLLLKPELFPPGSPSWVKVFQGLVTVLVYGILFYPFFACLTTDYKLLGSCMGFFYAAIRLFFKLGISFQCWSSYQSEVKKLLYLVQLGFLPTYLCLGFIMIRFAVLLFLEVRKRWFPSARGVNERAAETAEISLVKESGIKYVKQLFNPALNSIAADETWYMRLMHFFYKPRADFKYSTQFIATLLVSAITVFQIFVTFLSEFDYLKNALMMLCTPGWCEDFMGVVFGSFQAATVLSAFISVIILVHFMKCHRNHVLQLYRGQRTFCQNMFVSPAKLVGKSLRFSGYQIAYTVLGYLTWIFFLAIVFLILGFFVKYAKYFSPALWDKIKDFGLAILPSVTMAVVLLLFQMFLAFCIFRDGDFPNITITVDNRRLFSIMSFFFFFYNVLLGVFSCVLRIVFGMVLGVLFLSRIDRTSLMVGFQQWDRGFVAYLGFINVLVAHSHPVMLVFCQLLLNRNKYGGLEESAPNNQHSMRPGSSRKTESGTAYPREVRLPRLSQKAVNRWQVAVTLLRNPSLVKHRKQGGIARETSVSLRSIRADISDLV